MTKHEDLALPLIKWTLCLRNRSQLNMTSEIQSLGNIYDNRLERKHQSKPREIHTKKPQNETRLEMFVCVRVHACMCVCVCVCVCVCLSSLVCMFRVSYMHVFCIFVFAPVQHWACFTWKGALEIRSLSSLLLNDRWKEPYTKSTFRQLLWFINRMGVYLFGLL